MLLSEGRIEGSRRGNLRAKPGALGGEPVKQGRQEWPSGVPCNHPTRSALGKSPRGHGTSE